MQIATDLRFVLVAAAVVDGEGQHAAGNYCRLNFLCGCWWARMVAEVDIAALMMVRMEVGRKSLFCSPKKSCENN